MWDAGFCYSNLGPYSTPAISSDASSPCPARQKKRFYYLFLFGCRLEIFNIFNIRFIVKAIKIHSDYQMWGCVLSKRSVGQKNTILCLGIVGSHTHVDAAWHAPSTLTPLGAQSYTIHGNDTPCLHWSEETSTCPPKSIEMCWNKTYPRSAMVFGQVVLVKWHPHWCWRPMETWHRTKMISVSLFTCQWF